MYFAATYAVRVLEVFLAEFQHAGTGGYQSPRVKQLMLNYIVSGSVFGAEVLLYSHGLSSQNQLCQDMGRH